MAIGFSLSYVSEMEIDDKEKAIYFQLKNVRYKIIIDDDEMAKKMIDAVTKCMTKTNGSKKKVILPEFYKND
jgi:hypothetical protein